MDALGCGHVAEVDQGHRRGLQRLCRQRSEGAFYEVPSPSAVAMAGFADIGFLE